MAVIQFKQLVLLLLKSESQEIEFHEIEIIILLN
jgi:hypothetical protein